LLAVLGPLSTPKILCLGPNILGLLTDACAEPQQLVPEGSRNFAHTDPDPVNYLFGSPHSVVGCLLGVVASILGSAIVYFRFSSGAVQWFSGC
jgi:hypothetical protein